MLYFVAVIYALQLNICHKMECKFAVLIALDIKDCIKGNIKEHKEFSVLPEHRINQCTFADYYERGHALLT